MLRSILVPLDGSKFGEQALPIAAQLARAAHAKLHVAEVSHETVVGNEFGAVAVVDTRPVETVRAYLSEVSQRLTISCPTPPVVNVLRGPTIEALGKFVDENKIDLIVMTTHGRGPLARAWLGSTADELTRTVKIPVLLLRPHEGDRLPVDGTGFRHLLVALDGSSDAEAAIPSGLELAKLSGAELTLLRVIEIVPAVGLETAPFGLPLPDPELLNAIRSDVQNYVAQLAKKLSDRGVAVKGAVVEHSNVEAAILEDAKLRGCDLIVLATHGYGGLKRLLLGSVTDKVARGADAAVLVCHTMARSAPTAKRPSGEKTMAEPDDLTTIFRTGDPNLAQIVANELRAEGIAATVSGENQAGLSGILDVEVLVRAWDADRAKKFLEEGGHHDKPDYGREPVQKGSSSDHGPPGPQNKNPKIT